MPYKIWCIILGGSPASSIDINEDEVVDDLKKAIKTTWPSQLDGIDAGYLMLYKVNIDLPENDDKAVRQTIGDISEGRYQLPEGMEPLDPMRELSKVFEDGPPRRRMLHILVLPPRRSTPPESEAPDDKKRKVECKPSPTLRDYLLPHQDFQDAHLPKMTYIAPTKVPSKGTMANQGVRYATPTSVNTSPFDPKVALDWNRIPYEVHLCNMLPGMLRHFHQVLLGYPNADLPASEGTKTAYRAAIDDFTELELLDESSVFRAANGLMSVIRHTYEGLTGSKVRSRTELASDVTDYVIHRGSGGEQVLVLWENEAPAVFQHRVKGLHSELHNSPVKYNLNQVRWEGWQAILAKIAWHSSDLEEKPRWAILYGGNEFIAVYIAYVPDVFSIDRPVLYCSHLHDTMNTEFPLSSVALYMALTAAKSKEVFRHLQLTKPSNIPAALQIKDSNLRPATLEELTMAPVVNIKIAGDRTVPWRLIRAPVCKEEAEVEDILLGEEIEAILSEESKRLPTIFLKKLPALGSTGNTYLTPDGKLAVKISHPDETSREAMRTEARIYDNLTTGVYAKKYGFFRLGLKNVVLVLSNEGEPVHFDSWSNADRAQTLKSLSRLHHAGIKHGDVAERNIVQRRGCRPVIIDFSHASYHVCEGEDRCQELIEAKVLLKPIPEGLPQTTVAGIVLMLFALLIAVPSRYDSHGVVGRL